jgi:4-carboxymuconolactone decarboxylase
MSMAKKGQETFSKMFGAQYSEKFASELNKISPEFARVVNSFLVPQIWAMDKMGLKTKILCAFSALAALGKPETQTFAYGAYNHGVTREQLAEVILIVGIEAGFPAALQAFKWANVAWEQYSKAQGKGTKP